MIKTKREGFSLSYNGLHIADYDSYDNALKGMTECQFLDHESNCDSDCKFDSDCSYKESRYGINELEL